MLQKLSLQVYLSNAIIFYEMMQLQDHEYVSLFPEKFIIKHAKIVMNIYTKIKVK